MPTNNNPSITVAKAYPKLDSKSATMVHLVTFCVLLTVIATISSCVATTPDEEDGNDNSFHVGWRTKTNRLDFVFNLNQTIDDNSKLTSQYEADLTAQCIGHEACLFQDGKLSRTYELKRDLSVLINSPFEFKMKSSSEQVDCSQGRINVFTHCSTHWNPPIHTYGSECDHTIEWHSPISCPLESKNHQRPCYSYNEEGSLVDLTRLIKSDGSSYKISTGNHTFVKDFHFNICNEASDSCAPNVSSCYTGRQGLVESGFNNLTSISHKNKTFVITSLGEVNKNCTPNRVKTVINLSCSRNMTSNQGPQLVHSTDCENIVEWHTLEACPLPDIQVPATMCAIRNNELGINIDLRQLTNNQTIVKVPKFKLNDTEYTIILGLCRGISSETLKCENKSTSTTSACLVENNVSSAVNSSKTNITESTANNKSCQISKNNNLIITKPVVTRIEFYCSPTANATVPRFLAYEDCTYILEWPSSTLCSLLKGPPDLAEDSSQLNKKFTNSTATVLPAKPLNNTQNLSKNDPQSILNQKSKSGSDKHRDTLNEAKIMGANTKKLEESPLPDKHFPKTQIPLFEPKDKNQPSFPEPHNLPAEPQPTYQADRMNNVHKFFMVGLIVMSMGAFIIVIFLLDKKTQDGSPIDRMLQPWKFKPSLFIEDNLRGRMRRRRNDDGGSIGLIEAEDP